MCAARELCHRSDATVSTLWPVHATFANLFCLHRYPPSSVPQVKEKNEIAFGQNNLFQFSLQPAQAIGHNRIAEYNYTVAAVIGFDYLLFDGIDWRAA